VLASAAAVGIVRAVEALLTVCVAGADVLPVKLLSPLV
jgi:hypothetical protein